MVFKSKTYLLKFSFHRVARFNSFKKKFKWNEFVLFKGNLIFPIWKEKNCSIFQKPWKGLINFKRSVKIIAVESQLEMMEHSKLKMNGFLEGIRKWIMIKHSSSLLVNKHLKGILEWVKRKLQRKSFKLVILNKELVHWLIEFPSGSRLIGMS